MKLSSKINNNKEAAGKDHSASGVAVSPSIPEAPDLRAVNVLVFMAFCIDVIASFPGDIVTVLKIGVLAVIVICTIFLFLFVGKKVKPSGVFLWTYLYQLLLLVRLVNDFVFEDIPFFIYGTPTTLLAIFTCTVILPGIVLGMQQCRLDMDRIVLCFKVLYIVVLGLSMKDILSGNLINAADGRFSGNGVLDMIYMGHQGVTLVLLSFYRFRKNRVLNVACILMGLFIVVLAGSRGPIAALGICMFFILFFKVRSVQGRLLTFLVVVAFLVIFPLMISGLNDFLKDEGIHSFDRIVRFLDGKTKYGDRSDLLGVGMEAFMSSPLTGSSYLLPNINGYVHNIFMEQYMALGVVGGTMFLLIVIYTLVKGFVHWDAEDDRSAKIFYVLFIQYVIFGFFSRTIVALPQLWICMYIVMHYGSRRYVGEENRITKLKIE